MSRWRGARSATSARTPTLALAPAPEARAGPASAAGLRPRGHLTTAHTWPGPFCEAARYPAVKQRRPLASIQATTQMPTGLHKSHKGGQTLTSEAGAAKGHLLPGSSQQDPCESDSLCRLPVGCDHARCRGHILIL